MKGMGSQSVGWLEGLLFVRDRSRVPRPAPAAGLYLREVGYVMRQYPTGIYRYFERMGRRENERDHGNERERESTGERERERGKKK